MNNKKPRYMEVRDEIMRAVAEDNILSNGRLPSEEELAKMFGVSRVTVRSALQVLESEGIVEKKHGTGNFVHPSNGARSRNASYWMPYFTKNARPGVKECYIRQTGMPHFAAEQLGVQAGTDALEVFKRLESNAQEIVCMHEFFPMEYVEKIPSPEELPESIYNFFALFCGGIMIREVITDILPILAENSPFRNVKDVALMQEEVFLDTLDRKVGFSRYYMNPTLVRPKVIRNKPPQYWGVV